MTHEERINRLKAALVTNLAALGVTVVPKRTSPLQWFLHVLAWPFVKLAGKSYIDDYVTTGLNKIYVGIPADQPQTTEQAIRVVDVTTLAHEMTHVYQARRGLVAHSLGYVSPQLPIMLVALACIPLHVWLASLSAWGHLVILVYLVAIAFSFTPLVALIPWRPRFDTEHDAYITSVFTMHALYGYVDRQYVIDYFTSQLAGSPYLWPAPHEVALRAAEVAHDRVSRRDPALLNEPSRRFVKEFLG